MGELRRLLKSLAGACIWIHQTQFGIIYEVSRLASLAPEALGSVTQLRPFIRASVKLTNRIRNDHVAVKYFTWSHLASRPPQLFVFADASYAALRNAGST